MLQNYIRVFYCCLLFVQDAYINNNYSNGSDDHSNHANLSSGVYRRSLNNFVQSKASGRAGNNERCHYEPEPRPSAMQSSRNSDENRRNERMANELDSRSRRCRDLGDDSSTDDQTDVTTYRYGLFHRIETSGNEFIFFVSWLP